MHGGNDCRVWTALEWRGAGDDAAHARYARSHDRHVGGRDHGMPAPRDVAADRIHRDVLVAEHNAGKSLYFEVAQRFPLLLGKVAHLRLGKFYIVKIALADLADCALDFRDCE